jgi:hypothetical protein
MSVPVAVRSGYSTGFLTVSGQMYEVNGWPPIITSTRRSVSLGTTCTPEPDGFDCAAAARGNDAKKISEIAIRHTGHLFIASSLSLDSSNLEDSSDQFGEAWPRITRIKRIYTNDSCQFVRFE